LCVNPDYIGGQHSYAIGSRDTNAAVNIIKTEKEDALKKLFYGSAQFGKLMSNFLSV
jgi:hypothetical protein